MDNIDIRLLRVFVALTDAPGFADAELVLNPSQSTLSTHLAGQAIYDAAQKLFLDLGEFSRRVGSATGSLAGRLRHGASEGTFTSRSLGLQHIIRRFDGLWCRHFSRTNAGHAFGAGTESGRWRTRLCLDPSHCLPDFKRLKSTIAAFLDAAA